MVIRILKSVRVFLCLLAPSLAIGAQEYLFVFDRGGSTSAVFDSATMERIATASVGAGARHAYGVDGGSEVDRKFFVVARDAVVVLAWDFSVLRTISLSGELAAGPNASAYSPETDRLLVAAGGQVHIFDTRKATLITTVTGNFAAGGVLFAPGGSEAYVTASGSPVLRTLDLPANAYRATARLLPSPPRALAASSLDSVVHVAVDGALFDLEGLDEMPAEVAVRLGGQSSGSGSLTLTGRAANAGAPEAFSVDKLLFSNNERYYVLSKGRVFSGLAGTQTVQAELMNPLSGLAFESAITDVTANADGSTAYVALGDERKVIQLSPMEGMQSSSLTLEFEPGAVSLTSPRPAAAPGSLLRVQGNGTTVAGGRDFQLVVRAETPNGQPQSGVAVYVSNISPPGVAVTCYPGLTGSDGRASIFCDTGVPQQDRDLEITVTDALGRSAPPFRVRLVVPQEVEGLSKVSGDGETVRSNDMIDLVVVAVKDRLLQPGVALTITKTESSPLLVCPATATTGADGRATIRCTTGTVGMRTGVEVTVTDTLGRSVVFEFTLDVGDALFTGVVKISGDFQRVRQGALLPQPLVVQSLINGVGDPNAFLSVAIDQFQKQFLQCPNVVFTNNEGFGIIQCRARFVFQDYFVLVGVSAGGLRTLAQPFTVTILLVGGDSGSAGNLIPLGSQEINGKVGDTLEGAIAVRAVNSNLTATPNVRILFESLNNVTITPSSILTDEKGEAHVDVVLGCNAGNMGTILARREDGAGEVEYTFTADPGLLEVFTKQQGDNQSGNPGQALNATALRVRASNLCDVPVNAVPVTWRVNPPTSATLRNASAATNRDGLASALVTLGNYGGPFTVTVRAGDATAVFNLAVNVTANQLVKRAGDLQSVAPGQFGAEPLLVEVRGTNGFGVAGQMVRFEVTQGNASLQTPEVMSDQLGLAFTRLRVNPGSGPVRVRASAIGRTVEFQVNVTGTVPVVPANGFVDAASFTTGLVPGSLAAIFGTGIVSGNVGTTVAQSVPLPTTLAGVTIRINGVAAPLIAVIKGAQSDQVNLQVPFGLTAPGMATVVVDNNGAAATFENVPLLAVKPAIFVPNTANNVAAVLHFSDFSVVTPANPARPGEILVLYLTGLGATSPAVLTNQPGPIPAPLTVVKPVVGVDDAGMDVLGAAYAPNFLGLYQINFRLGVNVQAGNRKLNVAAGGQVSQATVLPVQR